MPGLRRLRRRARALAARRQPRAIVLAYHRVARVTSDPQLLCVRPAHFAQQLQCLRQQAQVLSLAELARCLGAGRLPRRAVVVTFDDGYVDNLEEAKPLLERFGVPATVFVTAGQVGRARGFWWDELEHLVLAAAPLPEVLSMRIDGSTQRWELGESARRPFGGLDHPERWTVECPDDPTPRHRAYRELHHVLRPLGEPERELALDDLRAAAGAGGPEWPVARALTADELRRLASDGLVEIGSHTLSHPVLAAQPPQAQLRELAESRRQLESLLAAPVTSLAYPYGTRADVSPLTRELANASGFAVACINEPGPVVGSSDRLALPRCLVRDWDGDEFAHRLRGLFEA